MASCRDSEIRTMSVKKQLEVMGAKTADDLISTMIADHEQAPRRGSNPNNSCNKKNTVVRRGNNVPPSNAATPLPCSSSPPQRSQSVPDQPLTSLVSRIWRSKTLVEDLTTPPISLPINQDHWKLLDKASKCAGPTCRRLFESSRIKRRNCAMCGSVFCFKCSNYTRRLSSNARPDPLGQFHSVCQACFNFHNQFGGMRDHIGEFCRVRHARVSLIRANEEAQGKFSLCSRRSTEGKKAMTRREIERLVNGFSTNTGKLKEMMSEIIVPDWQKCSNWVLSKNALACFNCGAKFGIMKRKFHCRIGGQVFCSNCSAEELILYLDDDGQVQWALNGKEGGPTSVPAKYQLLVVCRCCSAELQDILIESACAEPPSVFMDHLNALHSILSKLQHKIQDNLPGYKQLVESMEAADNTPNHVQDRNPMHRLVKAHADLSDAFSSLAVESQRLKQLKPKGYMQEKLLRNIMMGVYRLYSDNMYSFRDLKNHLSTFVPIETMGMIQASLSLQSLERVHVLVKQVIFEALNLEHQYKFSEDFFIPVVAISKHIDVEFKSFLEQQGESWATHCQAIDMFVEEAMKTNQKRIKIDSVMLHHRKTHVIYYLVVSQCSSLIHECYRELQAKTVDREFKMVKEGLRHAYEELDTILQSLNTFGRPQ